MSQLKLAHGTKNGKTKKKLLNTKTWLLRRNGPGDSPSMHYGNEATYLPHWLTRSERSIEIARQMDGANV